MQSRGEASAETVSAAVAPAGSPANRAQLAAWVWREVPVPVIAAVHGYAYGGGLQIALGADIRLVAPDAQLSVREIHWGLIPDMAGPTILRELVRLDVLKELTFSGRIVDGREAVALGLATRVSEHPLDDALRMAREIAGRSPDAIRAGKKLLDSVWRVGVAESLKLEETLQLSLMGTPNQVESVKANFEKRVPVFADPE
jgi:enoyl-CoA hydratase/carnithine racemase